jgi:16S rRNA (uracil1498-N3)-methyltransferase
MIEELKFKIKNENIEILVPYENEEDCSIKDINLNKEKIAAVVGPEGGFEEEEIQRLIEIGVKPVTLGPRILRSETAALVLSTLILHETDNMRRK